MATGLPLWSQRRRDFGKGQVQGREMNRGPWLIGDHGIESMSVQGRVSLILSGRGRPSLPAPPS